MATNGWNVGEPRRVAGAARTPVSGAAAYGTRPAVRDGAGRIEARRSRAHGTASLA